MGVDHGRRGDKSPRIWSSGTLMQIVSLKHLSYRYKMERSVAFKIRQNPVFGQGSALNPTGGAHHAPSEPLVGCGGDTPSHTPSHSAPTHLLRSPCVPPEFQPDLLLWLRVSVHNSYMHVRCFAATVQQWLWSENMILWQWQDQSCHLIKDILFQQITYSAR